MFYGLAKELIPDGGFRFQHILQDIQTLNERATRGELDISAVSIHAYAHVSRDYALLPSGASMGDGYGPMVIARHAYGINDLKKMTIAVPGATTQSTGLPDNNKMGGAYIMGAGTLGAHIMMPGS